LCNNVRPKKDIRKVHVWHFHITIGSDCRFSVYTLLPILEVRGQPLP
jgi:hypothetical protein